MAIVSHVNSPEPIVSRQATSQQRNALAPSHNLLDHLAGNAGNAAHDEIQNIMGGFGKYHLFVCFLMFISKFPVSFNQLVIIFLAPKVNYTCSDNDKLNYCPCQNPVYDKSIFTNTMIMQWNLICDKKPLVSLTQTVFQFGTLVGSIIFGIASDRYGRKKPIVVAAVLEAAMGLVAAYANNYWLFDFIRFLIGVSVGGLVVIAFVFVVEFVGAEYRQLIAALFFSTFNVGHMILPGISYLVRDIFRLQIIISAAASSLLLYIFLSETPRWLLTKGRSEQAVKVLTLVAKINNRPTDNIKRIVDSYSASLDPSKQQKTGTLLDIFKSPCLRINILAMSFDWLACSYCFYGVSQYVGQLGGNVFINVLASATVTFIGSLLSIPMMSLFGRKTLVIMLNYICAVCLIILAIKPEGLVSVICACAGVVASYMVFNVIFLYCSEMFPTVVRNSAIGFSSMSARIGSMLAPFVIELKPHGDWLPPLVFGIFPLIAGTTTFLLPETKGVPLMTTMEEGEAFCKRGK